MQATLTLSRIALSPNPQIHHLWRPISDLASPSLHCLPGAKPRSSLSQNGAYLSFHWTTAPFLYVTVCVLAINNTIHAFKIRNNVMKNYSDFQEKAIFWKLDILPSSGHVGVRIHGQASSSLLEHFLFWTMQDQLSENTFWLVWVSAVWNNTVS